MSTHSQTAHDIPHSPPFAGRFARGPVENTAVIQARLNEIARRDPTALLGVLEHWLGPQSAASDDVVDG
jgi:hypothetical protein